MELFGVHCDACGEAQTVVRPGAGGAACRRCGEALDLPAEGVDGLEAEVVRALHRLDDDWRIRQAEWVFGSDDEPTRLTPEQGHRRRVRGIVVGAIVAVVIPPAWGLVLPGSPLAEHRWTLGVAAGVLWAARQWWVTGLMLRASREHAAERLVYERRRAELTGLPD